jgi:hypothetical protein
VTDEQKKDELLWQTARRRAAFKKSLAIYIIVNIFLIGVWYFSSGPKSYFWPMWPLLGWGLGIAFQYASAYNGNQPFSAEKEYEKLKTQQKP